MTRGSRRTHFRTPASVLAVLILTGLSACAVNPPDVDRFDEPALLATRQKPLAADRPAACYNRDDTPAVIETVTQHVAEPATRGADGLVLTPVRYRTETYQRIVEGRNEIWFETPCRDLWTPEFIASVQRALIARDLLAGQATGQMDGDTRAAILTFQTPQGLNSDVLSVAGAKRLGLVVYDRATDLAG